MSKYLCLCVCAAALTLFLARPASADVMTYNGPGLSAFVQIHAPGHPGDGEILYAGQYKVTYQGDNYNAWCVDFGQNSGTMSATEESYTVLPNSSAVAFLFETYAGSLTSGTEAAALGTSIWEVITEPPGGPYNIGSGSFSISGNTAVANRAAVMLASIPASYTPLGELVVLHSATLQDMLIGRAQSEPPTPEPATIALLVGGAALGLARRRSRCILRAPR
jgi:hypothetical protein